MNQLPVIVIGAGGHAKALIDILHRLSAILLAVPAQQGLNVLKCSTKVIGRMRISLTMRHEMLGWWTGWSRLAPVIDARTSTSFILRRAISWNPGASCCFGQWKVGLAHGVLVMGHTSLMPVFMWLRSVWSTLGRRLIMIAILARIRILALERCCVALSAWALVLYWAGRLWSQGITIAAMLWSARGCVTKDVPAKHRRLAFRP